MKKWKKIISTAIFGIGALGAMPVIATSCGGEEPTPEEPVITLSGVEEWGTLDLRRITLFSATVSGTTDPLDWWVYEEDPGTGTLKPSKNCAEGMVITQTKAGSTYSYQITPPTETINDYPLSLIIGDPTKPETVTGKVIYLQYIKQ